MKCKHIGNMVQEMTAILHPQMLRYRQYYITCRVLVISLQYNVDGRGYTFTRHNNKFTMNINTDVFFDDKGSPNAQVIPSEAVRRRQAPLPPPQKPQQQRSVFLSPFLCSFTAILLLLLAQKCLILYCKRNLKKGIIYTCKTA